MNTLEEAQQLVKSGIGNKGGCTCPCCGKHCEEYRFSVTANMARGLHELYITPGSLHLKDFAQGNSGGYNTFNSNVLKHFRLIQQEESVKKKPFNRSGLWSITTTGRLWVENALQIPKYVFVFDNKVSGFSDELWTWRDALRGKWSPEDARQETPGELV